MPYPISRLWGALLAAALLLVASQPALAHAQLLSTVPAANGTVAVAPAEVELVFNEPVSALAISLVQPDGSAIDLIDAATNGQTLTVALPSGLAQGTHVLSWRAVSVDSHPIAGSLVFSIGAAGGSASAMAPTASRATSLALWAAKSLLFVTVFFGVGGAVFALVAPLPMRARQIAVGLCALGLVVAPLSLGLQGLDALGLAPDAVLRSQPWSTGYSTSYGGTVLALTLALPLALLSLIWPVMLSMAWPPGFLAAVALAISGHAGAAEPQWLTRTAVAAHIGGILFWIGALLPLWVWLQEKDERADMALAQFSRRIPFAVAPILVSGATLAVIQLGPPGPAWLAPYGAILAAKLGLLVVLLALALANRLWLTAPAIAGQALARHRLRQSIMVEIGIVLIVLALVAGWRFTPPPRALAQVPVLSAPLYAHAMDNAVMVDMTITPGHAGPVVMDLFIIDTAGAALAPQSVTVTLSAPALGIEPIAADATLVDGLWRVDPLTIPVAGVWLVDIELRLSRFSQSRVQAEIEVPTREPIRPPAPG